MPQVKSSFPSREIQYETVQRLMMRQSHHSGRPYPEEIEQVMERLHRLSDTALGVVYTIALHVPPNKADEALIQLVQTLPESVIQSLHGQERAWIGYAHSALELCQQVEQKDRPTNCSPMLVPMLRFALKHGRGLDQLVKLGNLESWIDAYRLNPHGAETLLEVEHQAKDYDPILQLKERLDALPASDLPRPVHVFELASLEREDLELLLRKEPPALMQNLPYDNNRNDYGDTIEASVKRENDASPRQPTMLGERIIRRISEIRNEQRTQIFLQTSKEMESCLPFAQYRFSVYKRFKDLAPTTADALKLRQFILNTLWHDQPYTPAGLEETRVPTPNAARLQGLVNVLEELPAQEMERFFDPLQQRGLIEGLAGIGQFLLRIPPIEDAEPQDYKFWQDRFIADLQDQKLQPDNQAHLLLSKDLTPKHFDYIRSFHPEKYQILHAAQKRICEHPAFYPQHGGGAESVLRALWNALEDQRLAEKQSWVQRQFTQLKRSPRPEVRAIPTNTQLAECLFLPVESLKSAVVAIESKLFTGHTNESVLRRIATQFAELRYEMGGAAMRR